MKKINLILIMCFGLLWAQSAGDLQQKIKQKYGGLSSFQAEVVQNNYYAQIKRNIEYRGKIYFSPSRILMSFDKPSIQRLLIISGNAELYDAASNTLLRSKIMPEFGRMNPVEILQHYWDKSQVSISERQKNRWRVKLVPKDDPMLKELTALVDPNTGLVHSLSYSDFSDNTVSYSFSGIKLNQAIPASVWKYKYPDDVQVMSR